LKYELQQRMRYPAPGVESPADWEIYDRGQRLEPLQRHRAKLASGPLNEVLEYRIVEVVPDSVDPATPTIEEKHAAELEDLAAAEKRWAARAKRAATKLKKIRARKRRLERLYAPREEPPI
jgi:ATPase subunit of ABC transporter with duplicated ATPase domains